MKAFRLLWATYDLTSFSLCEHVTSFATKALKYHTEGPWSGSVFIHCLEFSVISSMFFHSHSSIPEGLDKNSQITFPLFSFHPEAHIQRLKSPQYLYFVI